MMEELITVIISIVLYIIVIRAFATSSKVRKGCFVVLIIPMLVVFIYIIAIGIYTITRPKGPQPKRVPDLPLSSMLLSVPS